MSQTTGLYTSIKTLAGTLLAVAHSRLELFANDLEEGRLRMVRLLFFSFFTLFFFFLGVILLTLLVIAVFWDSYRFLSIGIIVAVYLSIAGGLAIYITREIKSKSRPRLFAASLAEIAKDRAALGVEE